MQVRIAACLSCGHELNLMGWPLQAASACRQYTMEQTDGAIQLNSLEMSWTPFLSAEGCPRVAVISRIPPSQVECTGLSTCSRCSCCCCH